VIRAGLEAKESWQTTADELPGRSIQAAKQRADRNRRRGKRVHVRWMAADDEVVRAGVAAGETSEKITERLPGRTLCAVQTRRVVLREGERRAVERWTEAEDAALRASFRSGKSWKEVAEGLPARTTMAIKKRAPTVLRLRREGEGEGAEMERDSASDSG
jgi:hypothetical protein